MAFPDSFCVLTSLPSVFLAPWAKFALGPSTLVDPKLLPRNVYPKISTQAIIDNQKFLPSNSVPPLKIIY